MDIERFPNMKTIRPGRMIGHSRQAFTLIELLVVIGIISILVSMLLPALAGAKGSAKRIACLNLEKQLALVLRMYADDNKDFFPPRTQTNRWCTPLANVTTGQAPGRSITCKQDSERDSRMAARCGTRVRGGGSSPATGSAFSFELREWSS
jgi:prepilin-type N-terminal cleavage/methylation domain-containing protein